MTNISMRRKTVQERKERWDGVSHRRIGRINTGIACGHRSNSHARRDPTVCIDDCLGKEEDWMEDIMETYGGGLLSLLAGVATLGILSACLEDGGLFFELVRWYVIGILG